MSVCHQLLSHQLLTNCSSPTALVTNCLATLLAHSFWTAPSQLFQVQLINFLKNLSMIGGLLFVATISPEAHKGPSFGSVRAQSSCRIARLDEQQMRVD
jgi:hypothetical protein